MNRSRKRPDCRIVGAVSVALASWLSTTGCTDKSHDCTWLASCPMGGAGGEDQAAAGSSGWNTETAGTSGSKAAAAGSSALPCDGRCTGAKPLCDNTHGTCHECLVHSDCGDSTPVCNPETRTCVGCLEHDDCKTADASRCDSTSHTCTACKFDEDCSHISGKGVCLIDATQPTSRCVECTGKSATACGTANGVRLVCDSLKHECTTYAVQSSGLCQMCVSDAQCKPGQLCYEQTFEGQAVGYFCFDKQNDVENGTPADCTLPSNRLYVKTEVNAQSIDNETSTLCLLRASTCPALRDYSSVDCAPTGTPSDAHCGFVPGADSKCVPYGTSQYRCTTNCLNNYDCKAGSTCNTAVNPSVCTL